MKHQIYWEVCQTADAWVIQRTYDMPQGQKRFVWRKNVFEL